VILIIVIVIEDFDQTTAQAYQFYLSYGSFDKVFKVGLEAVQLNQKVKLANVIWAAVLYNPSGAMTEGYMVIY
jgi:hypothetical protein